MPAAPWADAVADCEGMPAERRAGGAESDCRGRPEEPCVRPEPGCGGVLDEPWAEPVPAGFAGGAGGRLPGSRDGSVRMGRRRKVVSAA
ncbi:hypothetical protein, partial [Streptomyces muensis]